MKDGRTLKNFQAWSHCSLREVLMVRTINTECWTFLCFWGGSVVLSPRPLGTENANGHEVDEDTLHLLDQLAAAADNPHDEGLENFKEKEDDHRHDLEADVAVPSAPTVDYLGSVLPDALKEARGVNEAEKCTDINTAHSEAMKASKTATIVLGEIKLLKIS